ncbi:uncharacterized protein M421DRAFT_102885 [Didymella exigua CBS 183.55]|uniref:N-acetyltransferase domain-containing protein n=1 Tax=Didymella exigua CBS 183.55 TaxID=1150837 RepID=A0A6A5RER3_9PLEO|nr:uncharacterized protein M421DRAFT_102885 [Didymella exigua CBS 183.55]KAF1925780.1 hypothetical protein M421DRAFT_102885 [Didymella exigua CBS 183.55]
MPKTTLTNIKTPNSSNPSSLKPRYEIRQLEHRHAEWAAVIVSHSNSFYSTVWPFLYPAKDGKDMIQLAIDADYLVRYQIGSGLSFGATAGKLCWDLSEPSVKEEGLEAEAERLLEQMDFPLVSVALSYDVHNALDTGKMEPLLAALPHLGLAYHVLEELDGRDPENLTPKGPNEVIFRNATSTRRDYEGDGIMTALARWLMREAAVSGYRGIQIEALADAVIHVWSTAESPFKGAVVSEFHTDTWKDEKGNLGFAPAHQRIAKYYVDLKPQA